MRLEGNYQCRSLKTYTPGHMPYMVMSSPGTYTQWNVVRRYVNVKCAWARHRKRKSRNEKSSTSVKRMWNA